MKNYRGHAENLHNNVKQTKNICEKEIILIPL